MQDAGFQLLNDEKIIAEARHSPKEDEEEDDDEGENDSQERVESQVAGTVQRSDATEQISEPPLLDEDG
ncbi:hypothetical protein AVEN_227969-1 [Araneus ventricosus]|uniref:Uncharacterized protein n=1 Tax=Araneus ventricosus TaxID=182803 RepID=A0A4Y2VIN8_ARAVE|nr:hypothetical protein AVEN_227969-1 [Araneus ventricosus]